MWAREAVGHNERTLVIGFVRTDEIESCPLAKDRQRALPARPGPGRASVAPGAPAHLLGTVQAASCGAHSDARPQAPSPQAR